MAMNNRLMRPVADAVAASAVVYHPEALAWQDAVVANGGSVGSSLQAVSDFCDAIDAAGIRDRFMRLSLLCGGNLSAATVPLYRSSSPTGTQYGNAVDGNVGPFVAGDYSEASGLLGNGLTKALETGIDLPTCYAFGMEYDNVHLMAYSPETLGAGGGAVIGGFIADAYVGLALFLTSSAADFYSGDYQGDHAVYGSSANDPGMYLAQVGSGPEGLLTRNNSSIKTSQNLSTPTSFDDIPTSLLVFSDSDELGNLSSIVNARLSAYSIGKSFASSAQRTAYYDAMVAFQSALERV
jgi:hypothetical protein